MRKNTIIALFVMFLLMGLSCVDAKDYSNHKDDSITLLNVSIPYKYTATYHSSGNTRWTRKWTVKYVPAKLKSATVKETSKSIPYDTKAISTGTFTAVDLNYVKSTDAITYQAVYSSGKVNIVKK